MDAYRFPASPPPPSSQAPPKRPSRVDGDELQVSSHNGGRLGKAHSIHNHHSQANDRSAQANDDAVLASSSTGSQARPSHSQAASHDVTRAKLSRRESTPPVPGTRPPAHERRHRRTSSTGSSIHGLLAIDAHHHGVRSRAASPEDMSPLLLYRPPSRTGPSSSPQVSALTIETRAAREKRNEGRDGGAGSSGGGGNSSGRSGDGGGGESRYRHTRQESGGSMTSVPRLLAQPRSRFSHPSGAGPAAVHSNGHAPGATPGVNGHGLLVKRTSSGRGRHDAHLYRGDHESEYSYETGEMGGDRSAAATPAPVQAPSRYRHYRGESDAAPLVPPPSKDSRGLSSPAPPASTLPPRVGRFGHPDAKSYTIAQSKGAPTRTAQPGHALLRIKKGVGMILVYPDDHWCDNCDNTGYVAYRPEQPCRFCWPKFAVPLTGSPHGDLRQYQWGALNYDKHNFQRPIPRFFIRRANASGPDTAVVPLDLARVVPSHLTLNHWPGSRAVARREDMEALERTFNPTQAWPPEGDRDCYEDRGAQRKGSSSPSSSSSSPSPSPSSNRVARILLRILTIGILGRGEGGGGGGGTRGNEHPPEGVWCFAPGDPRIGGELCRVCQGVGARGTALFVQKCDTCAGVGRRLDVYDRAALDPLPDDLYDE